MLWPQTLLPSAHGFCGHHAHLHQAMERERARRTDSTWESFMGQTWKWLHITSAHLAVVRTQLHTVSPKQEGGWEEVKLCLRRRLNCLMISWQFPHPKLLKLTLSFLFFKNEMSSFILGVFKSLSSFHCVIKCICWFQVYGQCKAIFYINKARRIFYLPAYNCTLRPGKRSL